MSLLYSFFSMKKLKKGISFFSLWDKKCKFDSTKCFIGPLAKMYDTKLGNYTRLRHFCTVAHAEIGNFCSIATGTKIGVAGHPTNLLSTNSIFYLDHSLNPRFKNQIEYTPYSPIKIGNDVWIGEKCLIMPGITIGDGAIIAAHAVVTKDVPPYAVVGGIPAKVIKFRFSEEIIEKLLSIKWWNMADDQIAMHKGIFAKENLSLQDLINEFG
ncbi:MAG: CatB-related O-acetyltransferase [Bacteroidaceae bacterium]|nr:CatB-related O-acetyltransferase [Bacteroidaceae bacterium]